MNVEDLLTRALAEEAEERQVDVPALHRETMRRLPAASPHRRTPLLAAAAAAAVVITGTVVTLSSLPGDRDDVIATDDARGVVADEFACPQVGRIDFRTTEEDGFLPDLSNGRTPADVARVEGAATYEFTVQGDTAMLRLGGEDGALGSVTHYALVDGTWEMQFADICAGSGDLPLAPTSDVLKLGTHGTAPWPAEDLAPTRFGELPAAFVDDRPYFNLAGVVEGHRSMFVRPCEGAGWCWYSGEPGSFLVTDPPLASSAVVGRPHDVSDFLVDPDLMVGRENPYAIWAYDVTGPSSFAAVLRDGTRVAVVEVSQPSWEGKKVLVVLAVRDQVERLELADAAGGTTTWTPDDIPE
jgi:hypothetical protein